MLEYTKLSLFDKNVKYIYTSWLHLYLFITASIFGDDTMQIRRLGGGSDTIFPAFAFAPYESLPLVSRLHDAKYSQGNI